VNFGLRVGWKQGGLHWIPIAVSTLRSTTSPRLSSLQLDLAGTPLNQSVESLIEDMGNDLQRIADEVTRIDREFEGAVNITVVSDSKFKTVLNTLDVSFCFAVLTRPRGHVDSPPLAPCRSSTVTVIANTLPTDSPGRRLQHYLQEGEVGTKGGGRTWDQKAVENVVRRFPASS